MYNEEFKYENLLTVTGLNSSLVAEYINNYFEKNKSNLLIVSNSLYDANQIYKSIHLINDNVYFFPMDEFATLASISASPDLKITRIDTLNKINSSKLIIVTNLTGFLKKLDKNINKLNVTKATKRKEILNFFENNSYIKTNLVTTTGEYAVRNFIIDVFPINYEQPVRLEFFGEDIESIRFFDETSQISNKICDNVELYTFSDNSSDEEYTLYDLIDNPVVFFFDYNKLQLSLKSYKEYKKDVNNIDAEKIYVDFNWNKIQYQIYINTLDDKPVNKKILSYNSRDILNFDNNFDQLKHFVDKNINDNIIIFMIKNMALKEKIINIFGNYISFNTYKKGFVNLIERDILRGFIFEKYIVISEYDIEKVSKNVKFINHYNIGRKIKGYEELKKGDYVVHISHGIGQYEGIVTLENKGIKKDYILINYAGNDKIYVQAQKIETLYKYADSDISEPKLNSLNSTSWEKTKYRIRNKIKDISKELIKLYAERELSEGEKYKDFPEEEMFALDFEYEETEDQKKCIEEILKDLNSKIPMDRLLCGDVGFGKTEVAMRAMFKTVMNNRQVAYLCPTTILSKQQYENCKKRFRHFPVNIELLNRFTSTKDFNRIIDGIKKGTIDIIIGTHRVLNEKLTFKHLGLLIIDEEQRFGVSQKEKIKSLKKNVNVLSLSATPIPRTLKMAMSGLKDMSIIDTPPINRYPIQTYVIEENDYILKDAIYKELARDGQVYVLNNNIKKLSELYVKIKNLVPESKVCIAHGKLEKNELNEIVNAFVEGQYNILLCTTIIETGIDIANVNTLIIENADNFGLSQLYQIRGRVGRSDRIAYAYLMYNKNKMINDIAVKRLKTIKEFTELGSGYKIAMRDLSIRGAGELLGSSQSGFIDSVGINLYMDMIDEEIKRLKGIDIQDNENLDKNLLDISTTISTDYIEDESLRIEMHKLINEINSKDSFDRIKNEIEDRFGKVNEDIINYMYEEWFQKEAENLEVKNVKYLYNNVEIEFPEKISNNIDGEKLFLQLYAINPKFKIKYFNKKLIVSLNIINRDNDYVKDLLDLLLLVKSCIKRG